MIKVTDRAIVELKKMLFEKVDMPQARLRLISGSKEEIGLGIDIETKTDYIVKYEGSPVLVVEKELASRLKGVTLDIEDNFSGTEFVLCYGSKV
ncbi:hypothetical protein ACFLTT_03685 [Chloroflexota bacterium]